MASLQLPSFDLTLDDLESTRTTITTFLDECESILCRSKLLSVFDYSEALRYVRCAILETYSLEKSGAPFLARCYLYRGDCLRGLGKFLEAQDSYQAAASVVVHLDGSVLLAGEDWLLHKAAVAQSKEKMLTMEHNVIEADFKEKRTGGLWDGHDMSAVENQQVVCSQDRDEELRLVGTATEMWDPEPELMVKEIVRYELVEVREAMVPCTTVNGGCEVVEKKARQLKNKKKSEGLRALAAEA